MLARAGPLRGAEQNTLLEKRQNYPHHRTLAAGPLARGRRVPKDEGGEDKSSQHTSWRDPSGGKKGRGVTWKIVLALTLLVSRETSPTSVLFMALLSSY